MITVRHACLWNNNPPDRFDILYPNWTWYNTKFVHLIIDYIDANRGKFRFREYLDYCYSATMFRIANILSVIWEYIFSWHNHITKLKSSERFPLNKRVIFLWAIIKMWIITDQREYQVFNGVCFPKLFNDTAEILSGSISITSEQGMGSHKNTLLRYI